LRAAADRFDHRVDVAFARHPLNDERLDSIIVAVFRQHGTTILAAGLTFPAPER
jgi:hypothetical protein